MIVQAQVALRLSRVGAVGLVVLLVMTLPAWAPITSVTAVQARAAQGTTPPTTSAVTPSDAPARPDDAQKPDLSAGTGALRGSAVDAKTGEAIASTTVSISLDGGRSSRSTVSDANGRFAFDRVASGSWYITGTKAGYTSGRYGAGTPFEIGPPQYFELRDGEVASDVAVRLWRQATVSGVVRDENGAPVPDVIVQAGARERSSGHSSWIVTATTDRDGKYSLTRLGPGDYALAALCGRPAASPVVSCDFPTTFYPSTFLAPNARLISVDAGDAITGIDIHRPAMPMVRVSGKVSNPPQDTEQDLAAELFSSRAGEPDADPGVSQVRLSADGSFTFPRVPAGQYVVRILSFPKASAVAGTAPGFQQLLGSGGMFSMGAGWFLPLAPMSPEPTLWNVVPLTVSNRDVENLMIALKTAGRMIGRAVLDTGGPIDPAVAVGTALMVYSAEGRTSPRFQVARIEEDGRFTTVGLPPGHYRLVVMSRSSGREPDSVASDWIRRWTLQSTSIGRQSLGDMTIEMGEQDVSDIVLTFTEHPAQLAGVVRNASGALTPDAVLYAFPTDRQTWLGTDGLPRTVQLARPTQLGRYRFDNLQPGDYYVVATAGQPARRSDAAFLEALVPRAVTVSLTAGSARTLDVIAVR